MVEPVPIARDTPDWTPGSFWAHPVGERYGHLRGLEELDVGLRLIVSLRR